MKLSEGQLAPSFILSSDQGTEISLVDFRNKKNVVLYFYPKDDTPGCTIEACGFRDTMKDIVKRDTVVFGVSPDSVKSHQKFIGKFKLNFPLLSDESKEMLEDYGVWIEKSMYGKKYMGVARTTFIIGKDGKIKRIFEGVKPQGHEQEVLTALKELS